MQTAIKDAEIGGIGKAVHFHEDGPFIGADLPTDATAVNSEVFDLGEAISGLTIRAYAGAAIAGASGASFAIKVFAGDNKDATAGSTDWTQVAQISASNGGTGTDMYKAGDEIGAWTPTPGLGYRYYYASLEGGTAISAGSVNVYNEKTR